MKKFLLIVFIVLAIVSVSQGQIPAGNVCTGHFSGTQQCTFNGRIYRAVVPANLPDGAPIFVGLHSSQPATIFAANGFMSTTGWDLTWATSKKAIALFPEASIDANGQKNWCIDFNGCTVDDVSFIRDLTLKYATMFNSDPKRLYVAGFSMGADMVYKVARGASEVFAAGAAIEGHEWVLNVGAPLPHFPPINPVSMFIICGAKDTILPCKGGMNTAQTVVVPSSDDDFYFWVHVDGLLDTTAIDPIIRPDGTFKTHKLAAANLHPTVQDITSSPSGSVTFHWDMTANQWVASGPTTFTVPYPPPPVINAPSPYAVEFYLFPLGGHNWYRSSLTDPTQPSFQPDIAKLANSTNPELLNITTSGLVEKYFLEHPKP